MQTIRDTLAENVGGAHDLATPEHQFSLESVPDLTGKVAVITGATEGIGYATTHTMLARNVAHVHLLSPSKEVAEDALKKLSDDSSEEKKRMTWHQVDMGDWKAVQKVGADIAQSHDRLDILVNNAGRGIMTYQVAEQTGIDRHMSVNHLGHVVLTSMLLPLMKKTAENGHTVRISNQASNAHQGAPADTKFASVDELNTDLGPNPQYGRSKLASILYSRYLAKHLKDTHPRILVNATHPGVVHTTMSTRDIHEPYPIAGYVMSTLLKPLKKDQWEGAVSTLFAATATEHSGQYICPPATPEPGSKLANDAQLGEQLMRLTREILCSKLGVDHWDDI